MTAPNFRQVGLPIVAACAAISGTALRMNAQHLPYPNTRKIQQTDTYFGTRVSDPYRWLEDDNSDETKAWVEAQNRVTFDYLAKIPYRTRIADRLKQLINYPRYSAPFRKGDTIYF